MIFLICVLSVFFYDGALSKELRHFLKDSNSSQGCTPFMTVGQFEGDAYYFETSLTGNYFQATEFCRRMNMELLSIETREENDYIWGYLKSTVGSNKWTDYEFWTSGNRLQDNKNLSWMSTNGPMNYTNFLDDGDNNDRRCVGVIYSGANEEIGWNFKTCSDVLHVICEKKNCQGVL